MRMTLSVLRCPDAVPPETRTAQGGEFSIGRGPDNSWVLPDPDRYLSKRHCVLAFRGGGWQLADTSTNGTFLNREDIAVGVGVIRDLRDGDRIHLGTYEIEVRLEESDAHHAPPGAGGRDPFALPAANPFDDDLLAPPLDARAGPSGSVSPDAESARLPGDFDPLAAEDLLHPTQPDHAPSTSDAFRPPSPTPSLLPDDWDLGDEPPAQPAPKAPPAPPPTAAPPQASPATPPAAHRGPQAADDHELLDAFLAGAGMPDAVPPDPMAAMHALGAAFRALVAGLRTVLIARSALKGEFRIEQTMIRARGNNPLKFAANDDDALAALLGAGRRAEMAPADAVADALRDIRLHELASVAAMQAAVRALLDGLEPGAIRASANARGGLSALPVQRKARAWDAYEALHARTMAALSDDFESLFGRAFARAYERALRDIGGKETS